ncbi:glycosyl hydrolase family 28-related protein [Providencia sp. PROV150]|uniref:tail fiber/spike domain-containing protein n=1 Tax=Providencia sp. PROV150 TaxID=2949860 RepID=UPI00234BA054|nr:glycosyl hydrolase family 28-related protein [Providencia sp. PROV150]
MREVKPTQKPAPSGDIKDLFFNSGLLDIWATSLEHKYIDRFGNCHLTAAGMEWLFKELVETFKVDMNTAIVAAGYITIDSFQQGADLPNNEITLRNHILRDETTGEYYRWDGNLPKQVPAGSTPQSTGGIGKGAWVSVGDASLRSDLKRPTGTSIISHLEQSLSQKLSIFIDVRDFGAKLNGTKDDTKSIQMALDFVGAAGGGVVYFPAGKALISMKESFHPYSCLIIPANVELLGAGKLSTLITRPDNEREADGVLMCNKNYDVNTLYSADGNIIIRHIGLDDGAHNKHRGLGDLIGFGNGDGLLVEQCYFGNHDQHAIDICKSRNVIVRNNASKNKVNMPASATYQIDGGLIWGIAGGVTPSYNVFIYSNDIQESHANMVIHFHGENAGNNIHIFDNDIDATMLPDNSNVIAGDTDITYQDVYIHNNRIKLNNKTCRGINFPVTQGVSTVKNLNVFDNEISGVFRIGVFAGDDAIDFTKPSDLNDVHIYGNTLNVDLSNYDGLPIRLISAAGNKKARIYGNIINIKLDDTFTAGITFIEDRDNIDAFIKDNEIHQVGDKVFNGTSAILSTLAKLDAAGIKKKLIIDDNTFDGVNCDYHIEVRDPNQSDANHVSNIQGRISRNSFDGIVNKANIFEPIALSDGSNNVGYVDFTGQPRVTPDSKHILKIVNGEIYKNIPLTGKKKSKRRDSRGSGVNIDLIYSPLSIDSDVVGSGFASDVEEINNVYLSSTQCAGTNIVNVNTTDGVFDIITGNAGVTMVISDNGFKPDIRESGFIKVRCGI